MMFALVAMKFDYGKMATFERNAQEKGDLFTVHNSSMIGADSAEDVSNPNGKVIDLVLPIIILIISCLIGMIYTGGFFEGTGFVFLYIIVSPLSIMNSPLSFKPISSYKS